MVIPEIARQMQAKALEWKNRAATGPKTPPLPVVLEKLSAGYLVPKKAARMTSNQRQVTAVGSELTAQLTVLTGQAAHTERIDLHPSGRWLVETKKDGALLVWDMVPPKASGSMLLSQIIYVNADFGYLNRRPTLRRFNADGTAFLIILGEKRFAHGIFTNGKLSPLKETALDYPPKWFSPSRRFVARISRINGVHVEVQDLRGEIPATLIQTPGQSTLSFVFSPDDTHAAVVTSDGTKGQITLWNWRENSALHTFTSSAQGYHAIHFSPVGRRLFAVTDAREIMAWNIAEPAKPLYRVPLGTKSAVQLRTDPTGKWLLAHWSTNPSGVGDPQNWQVINAQNGAVAYAEFQPSTPLSFSINGKWIASKGASGLPSVYDLEQKKPVSPPTLKAKVGQFHFARGNTLLVIRTIDGRAHLLNFE
jgi:WD40 repeat protein